MKRRWLSTGLLGLALAAGCGGAAAEDLLAVYAQARAADPLLAAADARRGVQQEVALQARSALLPQWQLQASDARSQQDGSHTRQLDSSVSQALVDLGALRRWDAERTQTTAEEARLRAAEQDLCARVARAYFGVLSAQAALATTQANEDAFTVQVVQEQKRFEAGLAAQLDVEQARTYQALARGATVQARQALADARQALAEITGRLPGRLRPLARTLPALPPAPLDAQAWVERALRDNPALLAQALDVDAGAQRIAAARAGHWPTLSAGIDTTRGSGAAVAEPDRGRSITQVALRLTVPLFAGGLVDSQVRQAALQRDAARQALLAARRAVTREVQAQYQAVLAGVALMDSTRAAVAAADRALASTRTGQTLGTRSTTDLLLAIQTQAAAQGALDQARHGYVLARLLLLQAVGGLDAAALADVDRLLAAPESAEGES